MKKRIKIIIVAAVVIIAATTATVLFAYLQSMVNQPNKFNIGEGNIAVTEVFTEPDSMTMGDFFEKVVNHYNREIGYACAKEITEMITGIFSESRSAVKASSGAEKIPKPRPA